MIDIKDLTLKYKDKYILDKINIKINKGDRIALVGGNGAGKTTLIEIMLGIQKPTSGKVSFNFDYKTTPLERIGVQFQDAKFPLGLTVKNLIAFFEEKALSVNKKVLEKFRKELGIDEFSERDAALISGGQAQKLNVLLSLINNPEILVLDELTTGLDIYAKSQILKIVQEYLKGTNKTLILVTHSKTEVEEFANRVILLKNGKKLIDENKSALVKKYKKISNVLDHI